MSRKYVMKVTLTEAKGLIPKTAARQEIPRYARNDAGRDLSNLLAGQHTSTCLQKFAHLRWINIGTKGREAPKRR